MALVMLKLVALLPLVALSACSSSGSVGDATSMASSSGVQSLPAGIPKSSPDSGVALSPKKADDGATDHPPVDGSNQALVDSVADTIESLPESRSSIGGLEVDVKNKVVTVWWVGNTPASLDDLVTRRPYGVDIDVHPALHPRRLLESVAGKIVQDGIDGRGPSVYSAGARTDGSGISVSVAPDAKVPDAQVVETALKQIRAKYGSGLGLRVEIGTGITGTVARTR